MRRRAVRAIRLAATVVVCMLPAGAPAASGQQVYAACAACHGVRAEGNPAVGAPALAGQSAAYLERQLRNFRSGVRGAHPEDTYGAQMRATATSLLRDEAAVVAVARYVASLPKNRVKPGQYDARNGNNLYQGKCGACHGGGAEGNESLATPRLAGLDAAYLERQYRNFARGIRGAHPQDTYGKQMALMAKQLTTDRDLDDVIGHIESAGSAR